MGDALLGLGDSFLCPDSKARCSSYDERKMERSIPTDRRDETSLCEEMYPRGSKEVSNFAWDLVYLIRQQKGGCTPGMGIWLSRTSRGNTQMRSG
jgi:hypothetical protein